ncbi:MAG: DNA repair protein RadC [Patescibacteria group bacterium]
MPKIKDIPKVDRPREKFLEKGPDALTKSELLAILLGSGIKGTNVKMLAQKILRKFGKNFINTTVDELTQISGIGQAKALQIASAFALACRIQNECDNSDNLILSAKDAVALVSDLKDKKQEHLVCLYLNARNLLLKKETVSIGTLDKSLIHPREIFAPGLKMHAAGVILIHNHPSGDVEPSEQDKQVAKRIIEAGKLMGINVIDFLIVAKNNSHSILGELQNTKLADTEYIAEGEQAALFDLLVDANQVYFYDTNTNDKTPKHDNKKNTLRFIDLFAGIGGFHTAFHNAGAKCVFVSEWDEQAQKTYRHNFYNMSPEVFHAGNFVGDITEIKSFSL